ncbi:MAG: AAA family ATPase [Thermomicrobiales bacterium]
MTATGSESTKLIIIRGNSASGKSTIARTIREQFGKRELTIVEQDYVRLQILNGYDGPGRPYVGLIDLIARYALKNGFHVIVEGILNAAANGAMLSQLAIDHRGENFAFYIDVPFDETVRRHATRPLASTVGVETMQGWYRPLDLIPAIDERVIPPESTLADSVALIRTTANL